MHPTQTHRETPLSGGVQAGRGGARPGQDSPHGTRSSAGRRLETSPYVSTSRPQAAEAAKKPREESIAADLEWIDLNEMFAD